MKVKFNDNHQKISWYLQQNPKERASNSHVLVQMKLLTFRT